MKSVKYINPFKSVMQTSCGIVGAHGGEFTIETKEGVGSKFIIEIPV